ncbi:MAG: DUF6067 family protein [Candidatus Omnitrophica bacterium]|nr:DUF6067 family protein [Candidatus Omnitrophota bacterium]MCM8803244.1 DUF6067 family protein [Candidatus Omnitrophota bacterium]
MKELKVLIKFLCIFLFVNSVFSQPVLLRVPKFEKVPEIDGVIKEEEWKQGTSFTGVCTWAAEGAPGQPPTIVPEIQQVIWYLGYDDYYLYIGMNSPHPEGTALKANVKKNDEGYLILFEDHTEIQISPYGRKEAVIPGYGFYKIMVNPRGYYSDQWFYNGTPGTEDAWTSGAEVKCNVGKTFWQMEMRIPFKTMGQKKTPEGKNWVIQLVRTDFCGGLYFAGWVGSSWMGWNVFPEVVFEKDAPSVHFRKIGDIVNGKLDTEIKLIGKKEEEIKVSIIIKNAEGKEIYKKEEERSLKKGISEVFKFKEENIQLSEEKKEGKYQQNWFEIKVTTREKTEDGEEKIIYSAKIPVIKMTDRYWTQFIKPWQEKRETFGEYEFKFAHYPYLKKFQAWIDLDMFGVSEEIKKADNFAITIKTKKGQVVKEVNGEIKELRGTILFDIDLKEGEYICLLGLYNGKKKVSERKEEFVREKWPWEKNNIGKEDMVIPPYEPIEVKENVLKVWNREYIIGKTGLPEKINVGGKNILGRPITILMRSEGKEYTLEGKGIELNYISPTKINLKGKSNIGSILIETDANFEYDGWYLVNLKIKPENKIKIDSFDMLWEVPSADTLVMQRGDCIENGYFGKFPEGEGIVFESKNLNPASKLLGTWVPAVFIGTGDYGLWYIGESDEGWVLDDNVSAITAERKNGIPYIRFRLFNKPYNLEKEREIKFALIATPVKPLPKNWRKIAWGYPEPWYVHDTRGYRYYGASVDGFELYSEEDYKNLRDVWLGLKKVPERSHGVRTFLLYQKPFVVYGSTEMTGVSKEFKTFSGEWLGITNYKPRPQYEFRNMQSDGGIIWETDEQLDSTGVNFTESYIDYYLWYHKNLVEKCFINGTWWDNSSTIFGGIGEPESWLILGKGYLREDGKIQGKSNLFTFRELTKRLNIMGWQVGRPPLYLSNMHPIYSFTQIGWHIENSFYSPSDDLIETLGSVDVFRALIKTKQGIISQLNSNPRSLKAIRIVLGLCLLHDIGERSIPSWNPYFYQLKEKILKILEQEISFFSGEPIFIPYWRQDIVKFSTEKVYASIYLYKQLQPWESNYLSKRKKAVIILLNENKNDTWIENFEIDSKKLGFEVSRIWDLETGFDVPLSYSKEKGYKFGETAPGKIFIKGHDFRILIIE